MKGIPVIKLKPIKARSLGRKALLVGAATAIVAGTATLTASNALAALGTGPGVTLSPASGPTTTTPTWTTASGCPAGNNASAVLKGVGPDGVTTTNLTGVTNSAVNPLNPGPAFLSNLATAQSVIGTPNGGTMEAVLFCYSGASATGTGVANQDEFITFDATGANYTTSTTAPGTATTTTLAVSPTSATVGSTVTLTATVTASSGTAAPTGTVTFMNGTTAIGSPVTLVAGTGATATASAQTSPTAAGTESITAVYSPATGFSGSTSAAVTLTVTNPAGSNIPLAVTVAATGTITLTVDTTTVVSLTQSGASATGATTPITVADSRNTFPGWSVSGQSTAFTESTTTPAGNIPAANLGWVPTDTALATGAVLGPTVPPNNPGLGTPAVLASAVPGGGTGTSTLGANLTLAIPTTAPAAAYSAFLTMTLATAGP